MSKELKELLQDEPECIYEDVINNMRCSCCGKEIKSMRMPVCVINPYECLCMQCFRAEFRDNALVIKENANNYKLRRELEQKYQHSAMERMHSDEQLCKMKEKVNASQEHLSDIKEWVDEAYYLAIATDSAAAIEIFRNLKDKIEKEG